MLTLNVPLGKFVCITGVSGSGKSSLVVDILHKKLAQVLNGADEAAGKHDALPARIAPLDKVIDIDQSPIGARPVQSRHLYRRVRAIRELFAGQRSQGARLKPGRFSFNVKGGRCEACQGDGIIKIEMQFLPDVYVACEICHGNATTAGAGNLVTGKTDLEVLEMTVAEAMEFFQKIPSIRDLLTLLHRVGLDYILVGQPATTL